MTVTTSLSIQVSCFRSNHINRSETCVGLTFAAGARVHEQSDNETVQTQNFSENEDKNHSDVKTRLLSGSTNASVTDNTNSETGSQTSQTNSKTSTKLNETSIQRQALVQIISNQDGNDQSINSNNTSHDNGDNVSNDQVRSENGHTAHTDTGFGGSIGGTKAGEDDGGGAAKGAEEGRVNRAKISRHLDDRYERETVREAVCILSELET